MTTKFTALTNLTTAEAADVFPVIDTSAGADGSKKITSTNLLASLITLLADNQVPWAKVNKSGSALSNLATRNATDLQFTANDKIICRHTDVVQEVDLTSVGRTILAATTEAAARTAIGIDLTTFQDNNGWTLISASSYEDEPLYEKFNSSSIASVSDWQASHAGYTGSIFFPLASFVKPTTPGDFIYQCMVAGTTDSTEPTWPTTNDTDVTDNDVTWRARGLNVIQLNVDLTSIITPGTPLKITFTDTVVNYYIVEYITTTRLVVSGKPLAVSNPITEIKYGKTDKVRQVHLFYSGAFQQDVESYMLTNRNESYYWLGPRAHLVGYIARGFTDDSVSNAYVTPYIDGDIVSTDNDDKGPQLITAPLPTVNYYTSYGNTLIIYSDYLDVKITSSSGFAVGTAEDLSVDMVFVSE